MMDITKSLNSVFHCSFHSMDHSRLGASAPIEYIVSIVRSMKSIILLSVLWCLLHHTVVDVSVLISNRTGTQLDRIGSVCNQFRIPVYLTTVDTPVPDYEVHLVNRLMNNCCFILIIALLTS
jgi:hypothetical protein